MLWVLAASQSELSRQGLPKDSEARDVMASRSFYLLDSNWFAGRCSDVVTVCVSLWWVNWWPHLWRRDNEPAVLVGRQKKYLAVTGTCCLSPGSWKEAPVLEHGCSRLQYPHQFDESMGPWPAFPADPDSTALLSRITSLLFSSPFHDPLLILGNSFF